MPHDGTCLFRVVAEQMFDSQKLHFEVRRECVRFMTLKRRLFEKQIAGDFDEHTLRMTRPRTQGTTVELRAMCLLYGRNLQFYQYNKPATFVTFSKAFAQHFTVYYSSSHHFDLLLTAEHYETAAAVQAICYKLVLKQLLKLPDVELAVERMLFPEFFRKSPLQRIGDRLHLSNGNSFQLDQPRHTSCMLIEEQQCSFHNGDSNVSCMRQLLDDRFVPFSYKVAKALHAQFYRNVELDLYRERLERHKKTRLPRHGYAYNLQVGDKCVVSTTLGDFDGYVQSINSATCSCIVFVVYWCQVVQVPLASVRPSPLDEFQQWPVAVEQQEPLNKERHFAADTGDSEEMRYMSNCVGLVSWSQVSTVTKNAFRWQQHESHNQRRANFHTAPKKQPMVPRMPQQQQCEYQMQVQQRSATTIPFSTLPMGNRF